MDLITLPKPNSSHLKMDGWNTFISFWEGLFSGANWLLVLGRVEAPSDHHLPSYSSTRRGYRVDLQSLQPGTPERCEVLLEVVS